MLAVGDSIILKKGDVLPVDAVCKSKNARVLKTRITGSTIPSMVKQGGKLLAGMTVESDILELKVTKVEADSWLAKMDVALKESPEKADIERTADRILQWFVPTVVVLAATFALSIAYFFTPVMAIYSAVTILVSACPCILGFVVPIAIKTGMTKGRNHGVNFKNGKALEAAAHIDTVVFDLNGTLTQGQPKVSHVQVLHEDIQKDEMLRLLQILERKSQHPIGQAIYAHCKDLRLYPRLSNALKLDESHHSGIKGLVEGKCIQVGNAAFMKNCGIDVGHIQHLGIAGQMIYVASNKAIIGYLTIKEPLRDDAKAIVNRLQRMGKEVHICTGADVKTANDYAKRLGIPKKNVSANCMAAALDANNPSVNTKTGYIAKLQEQGKRVAMIGDALNDAVAVKESDLGIAVCAPSTDEMTVNQADVVIKNQSLQPILTALAVGQQTVTNIKQNLALSLLYNLAIITVTGGVLVAAGITMSPAIGVLFMIFESCVLMLNTYRLKYKSVPTLNLLKASPSQQPPGYQQVLASANTHKHNHNHQLHPPAYSKLFPVQKRHAKVVNDPKFVQNTPIDKSESDSCNNNF